MTKSTTRTITPAPRTPTGGASDGTPGGAPSGGAPSGGAPSDGTPSDGTPSDGTDQRRAGLTRSLPLLLPAVVMAALGLWDLGRHDAMGNDEVATRWISSLNLRAMAHVLDRLDAVHGLYYVLIHFWSVLGDTPTAIRVPSVLAAVAAVVVVGLIGVRLSGSMLVGTVAGLVAALTPSVAFYAQTARSYALVYLVVALATLVLLRALDLEDGPGGRAALLRGWLPYSALIVLGAYLNELSLLVLGAHLVTVVLARRGRGAGLRWLACAVVAVVAVSPLIVVSRRESMVLDNVGRPDLVDLQVLFHTYFGGIGAVAVVVAVFAVIGLVPCGKGTVSIASVAAPLAIVPVGLLLAYSEVFKPLYVERYVLYGEIGAALLAAAGLVRAVEWLGRRWNARRDQSRTAWATTLLACVVLFASQFGAQQELHTPKAREFNFGGPAGFVAKGSRPGDGVLFFDSFYRKVRLGYPEDFRGVNDFAMRVSPAQFANFRGRNQPMSVIRPLLLERRRIWVIGKNPYDTARSVANIQAQARLLERNFSVIEHHRFGRIDVTLWRRI